jgi:hypothetical protein
VEERGEGWVVVDRRGWGLRGGGDRVRGGWMGEGGSGWRERVGRRWR